VIVRLLLRGVRQDHVKIRVSDQSTDHRFVRSGTSPVGIDIQRYTPGVIGGPDESWQCPVEPRYGPDPAGFPAAARTVTAALAAQK